MQDYLERLTAQRRAAPRDDLLTRLVEAEVDGERLSPSDILGFFQLLLAAGTETTTNLIDNTVLCLCEHPDLRARLERAPELRPGAIEEVLRYRTPAQTVVRQTLREVEMHGQRIPAGQLVIVVTGAANRDPRVFTDPDKFDIARDPNPHVAFGQGIHFCIGAALSRLEGRVAVGELLRAPDLQLASHAPWQPRRALIAHGPVHLPIRFTPGPRGG
jgi:cytochrome P450